MKGLCETCFSSNIELFITKGRIHCESCRIIKDIKKERKNESKLPFEDLPQADLEHRSDKIYEYLSEKYDIELLAQIAEDRKFDKD